MKVLLYYLYYKYRRPFKDREVLEKWQEKKLKRKEQFTKEMIIEVQASV